MRIHIYTGIAIGGGLGSIMRYGIALTFNSSTGFPWGTLLANLIGCFILSFLYTWFASKKLSEFVKKGLATGLIGSLTTFSTLSIEVVSLTQQSIVLSFTYLILTVAVGLLFTIAGMKAGRRLFL
ncbi:CrcB family protein [Halobacillus sp. A1]|uniref:fluoride efflux transporter FluC n=1 Tax=Halobacillus sp. A1 TaxID=2880262 RepID=UPI0020A6D810|nr:CrcB family protein [Halobacillus sp. A1]MCP3032830.1 CrcB family protein [Halobacillus sp. A1]